MDKKKKLIILIVIAVLIIIGIGFYFIIHKSSNNNSNISKKCISFTKDNLKNLDGSITFINNEVTNLEVSYDIFNKSNECYKDVFIVINFNNSSTGEKYYISRSLSRIKSKEKISFNDLIPINIGNVDSITFTNYGGVITG